MIEIISNDIPVAYLCKMAPWQSLNVRPFC